MICYDCAEEQALKKQMYAKKAVAYLTCKTCGFSHMSAVQMKKHANEDHHVIARKLGNFMAAMSSASTSETVSSTVRMPKPKPMDPAIIRRRERFGGTQ